MDLGDSLVSIGTHHLFLSIRGVPRHPGDPLIVFIAGAGDVASSYSAVARQVATFAPLILYDRSGLGRSQDGPHPPTPTTAATELHQLLTNACLLPPFILVAHSYGATIAREYLHLHPDNIAGMVLADASAERQSDLFQTAESIIGPVLGNLNFAQVTGLRASAQLSRDEWRARAADIARGVSTWQAEASDMEGICQTLAEKNQYERRALGERPLVVIRCRASLDYEKIYEAGLEVGNGSEEQRAAFRGLLDRWDGFVLGMQGEQVRLSLNSRLVDLVDCGHHVHLLRPDVLAGEIRWVRDAILSGQGDLSSQKF